MKVQRTHRLPKKTADKVDTMAKKKDASKSLIVERAIDHYYKTFK